MTKSYFVKDLVPLAFYGTHGYRKKANGGHSVVVTLEFVELSSRVRTPLATHLKILYLGFLGDTFGAFSQMFNNMIMDTMYELIRYLKETGVLTSSRFERALRKVDRYNFVPEKAKKSAYIDRPLAIGKGQTISQPFTVLLMLELLQPKQGDRILDVGSGSGWQSALLAELVGSEGKIYAVERIRSLHETSKKNLSHYPELQKRITFLHKDAFNGLPDDLLQNGLDGVVVAAEVKVIPPPWRKQLKPGGKIIYPMGNGLYRETKREDGEFVISYYPGFVFVPFVRGTEN